MVWQDIIFGAGSIIFIVSLLPTVFSGKYPSIWTSVPTSIILYAFCLTYLSLDLIFAAITSFISATLWDIIALETFYKMEIEGPNWEKMEENHKEI